MDMTRGFRATWLRIACLPLSVVCAVLLFSFATRDVTAQGNPAVVGRWSSLPDLPFFPPHVHVLPTGQVLVWPGDIEGAGGASQANQATRHMCGIQ